MLGECCYFSVTKPQSLTINGHRRTKRVQCLLRSCELLDFHQELITYEVAWSLQKDIVKEKITNRK
jgi:lipoyl(octanoyl) transferase